MSSDRPRSRRRDVLKGLTTAGLVGLAGCAGGDGGGDGGGGGTPGGGSPTETTAPGGTTTGAATPAGAMGREIRLGILMGVTGGLEDLGPPIRNSAQLAANYMDSSSDTFSIESRFADTATDPNVGISQAESLVNQGFPMIAGALSSTVTLQVAKNVTIPNQIVQCSPASTSPAITDLQDSDYVWRTTPTDALQSKVMVQVAMNRLDAQTTSYLALNNDYGQGLAQAYAEAFRNQGGEVLAEVSFEPGQSSYTSKLAAALADRPDVLMIVGYPKSGIQIFRDFYADYSQDFTNILVPDGLKSESLPGNVGNDMSNVWGTAPLSVGPGKDFFLQKYKEQYGGNPKAPFTAQSFDAAAVLSLANAAAGANEGPAIRDEMMRIANPGGTTVTPETLAEGLTMAAEGTEINYQGAAGAITFDDAGDIAAATYELYRYGEDGLNTVDKIEYSK